MHHDVRGEVKDEQPFVGGDEYHEAVLLESVETAICRLDGDTIEEHKSSFRLSAAAADNGTDVVMTSPRVDLKVYDEARAADAAQASDSNMWRPW